MLYTKGFFKMSGCGTGYFEDQDTCECDLCPIGTYSDHEAVESCKDCPMGWTTLQAGSTREAQCRLSKKVNIKVQTSININLLKFV